jgi:tetratricopeptide (TPR) repeat protein
MKILQHIPLVFMLFVVAAGVQAQNERDKGIELYRLGKYSEAAEVLERSVKANEADRSAWVYLGAAYVHLDKKGKAKDAMSKAVSIKPGASQSSFEEPAKVTLKPRPNFFNSGHTPGISSGVVELAVELKADGTVGFAFPFKTSIGMFAGPAVDAAKQIRFEPAVLAGKPVTVINFVTYEYRSY